MKIAAAYIRVSTDDQTELSPDSQLKLLRDYAKAHDMILPDEYVFQDDGISGRTASKRPAFNTMIGTAKLKPKPFDVILLWKFSRFARNREDSIVYKSMLRKQLGIDVISISESIGDDKMSVLIEAMIEAMDEYYSLNLSEEVKRGMTEKVSRGLPVSIPSFGYDIIDKNYVPNPETAPLVKMIFEDYLAGVGTREIAMKMNSMGIRTRRGGLWENRTVDYILNNPVYIGKIRWNPAHRTRRNYDDENIMIVDGHHEPIISADLWEAVQDKLQKDKEIYRKYSRSKATDNGSWMLRSVLRCDACGGVITRATKVGVQCYKYAHGKCSKSHYCSMDKIERMVIDEIERIANGESELLISSESLSRTTLRNDHIKSTQSLLAAEERKLKRIKEAYAAGIDTLEEYQENKKKILATMERIKRDSPSDDDSTIAPKISKKEIKNLLKLLKNAKISTENKNEAIRRMVDYITFTRNEYSEFVTIYWNV